MAANRLVVGCGPTRVVSQHMGAPANRRTLDTTADQPGRRCSVGLARLQRKLAGAICARHEATGFRPRRSIHQDEGAYETPADEWQTAETLAVQGVAVLQTNIVMPLEVTRA